MLLTESFLNCDYSPGGKSHWALEGRGLAAAPPGTTAARRHVTRPTQPRRAGVAEKHFPSDVASGGVESVRGLGATDLRRPKICGGKTCGHAEGGLTVEEKQWSLSFFENQSINTLLTGNK